MCISFGHEIFPFLPPTNEVCEGYVFTRVCLSMGEVPGQVPPDQVHPLGPSTPPDQVHPQAGTRYTHPLGPGTPPGPGTSPWDQVYPQAGTPRPGTPPWAGTPPPRPGTPPTPTPWDQVYPQEQCMPGDTDNKRAVRILLECILVHFLFAERIRPANARMYFRLMRYWPAGPDINGRL